PLTPLATAEAESVWVYEIRGVWWSNCMTKPEDLFQPDHESWLPQDSVPLTDPIRPPLAAPYEPVDVAMIMGITATIPVDLPERLKDEPIFVIGYTLWVEAAVKAGMNDTWMVSQSTFEVSSVPVDADGEDPNCCAAVFVDCNWYALELHGDTVRARLAQAD
ncbi:hypothetical protein, partial [Kutzneria sp. NPDC052558]|uniref:hypothetical protein n=1 Tax=Kutzneria sp. NPDC052558 TaxID=3364121 RepID=UPI0037C58096